MAGTLYSLKDRVGIRRWEDFRALRKTLDRLIEDGKVKKVPVMKPRTWLEEQIGEEWFLDVETGDVYSYIPLMEKVLPQWRKVDPTEISEAKRLPDTDNNLDKVKPKGLAQLPIGRFNYSEADMFYGFLPGLISSGLAEPIEAPTPSSDPSRVEKWFRDTATGDIYRLSDDKYRGQILWDKVLPKQDSQIQ